MAQVILYEPASTPVANRVSQYLRSVEGYKYTDNPKALVYYTDGDPPDVAALFTAGVSMTMWKVSGSEVVELSAEDKALIAAANEAASIESQNAATDASRIADLDSKSVTSLLAKENIKPII